MDKRLELEMEEFKAVFPPPNNSVEAEEEETRRDSNNNWEQ